MGTAACGINCDVCRLKIVGICSTCGSGVSEDGAKKMEVQKQILGNACPILECAQMNRIAYCLRDCQSFPCENFTLGPYPFSQGFLNMQERRRHDKPLQYTPQGDILKVPAIHWEALKSREIHTLSQTALARALSPDRIELQVLHHTVQVDRNSREMFISKLGKWEPIESPLFQLLVLVYFLDVKDVPLANDVVSIKDLKDAQFFQGPHELKIAPVLDQYGNAPDEFKSAAEKLGGTPVNLADVAYKLTLFQRIPIYYLLWEGDEEFKPNMTVLFDRTIETHFSADAIWGAVNFVADALLLGEIS